MLTLFEAAKLNSGDVVRATIIEHFARSSELLRAAQFIDVQGGAYVYNMEGQLGASAFRGVGQGYTPSAGIVNPETERLRIIGGELDVDLATLKISGENVRSQYELMKVKSISLAIGAAMINGNSLNNPLEFDGLRQRIGGSQLVEAGGTDGGDPLSIQKLYELIDAVDNPTHLIMSKKMRALMSGAAHDTGVGGYISFTEDEFGRKVSTFDGLPILVTDYDNFGNQIVDFNEVGGTGATETATSIYAASMGPGGVIGLQNGTMDVRDLGELQTQPVMRTRVEWLVGMAVEGQRSAARLRGISNAAVTK